MVGKPKLDEAGNLVLDEEGNPIIEEEETPPKEKEAGEEVNWEERYKHLQGQTDRQVDKMQKELARHQKLLAPFSKNIKEDEEGNLIFDFSKTPQKLKEAPKPPTAEDWEINPAEAAKKYVDYREYLRDQKLAERQDAEKTISAERDYKTKRAEVWGQTQKMFPDVTNEDGDLRKRAQAILDEDPAMAASPFCDLMATRLAAAELGIQPVESSEKETPGKEKKTSYIIGGKGGGGGKGGEKEMTDEEFFKLPAEKQREIMKKQVMDKT